MLIFPKLLYLFRTLIIPIPHTFFSSIQKLFTQFIWNHKPPRYSLSIMLKHRKNGGMGVPNVLAYYKACVLDQLRYWWTPREHKSQSNMKRVNIPFKDLISTLIAIKLGAPSPTSLTPTIQISTKVCLEFPIPSTPRNLLCKINTVLRQFIPHIDLNPGKSKGLTLLKEQY